MNAQSGAHRGKIRFLIVLLVLLLLILAAAVGLGIYFFNMAGEMEYNPVKPKPVEKIRDDVVNIMLIGLDAREEGSDDGRNDLNMVLSLDYKHKKIKVASILRDSYVSIPGHKKGRINTAYRTGGPALVIDTVNSNFGLDIQHYVKVDFFGLAKIIDAAGGVTLKELSKAEAEQIRKYSYKKSSVKAGKNVKLNGAEAVAYGRIRKTDDDFGRTDRQREVFQLLVDKLFDMGKTELLSKMNAILKNLETNFTKDEIVNTAVEMLAAGFDKKIAKMHVPVKGSWENARIDGDAVLKIDIAENKKALKDFIYGG